MDDASLEVKDLHFHYGSTPVVRGVSHRFRPGKLTAICGPNGSGKSTLFGLAARQLAPARGSVTLAGQSVGGLSSKARARCMAMLPQSPQAPPELLVRDLVALGRYAHRKPLVGLTPKDRDAVASGLRATQMEDLADRPLGTLSGGQKQRTWIAMTLAQDAPLILLDEPTNHLDISHSVETMDLLRQLTHDQGKTVIVILHDLNLMASYADDVLLLRDGALQCAGPFEASISETVLTSVYNRPVSFGTISGRERPFVLVT